MVPHKDPSSLPVNNQVKLVRDKLDEIAWDLAAVKTKQRVQDDTLNVIRIDQKGTRSDIKSLAKQFRNQDQKFDRWKSKIHTLIDEAPPDLTVGVSSPRASSGAESLRSEIPSLSSASLRSGYFAKGDKGFTSKAKILDDEVGILNTRTVDLRKRVEKLETQQFATS